MRTLLFILLCISESTFAAIVSLNFNDLTPDVVVTNQYPGVSFSLAEPAPIVGPTAYQLSSEISGVGNIVLLARNTPIIRPAYDINIDFIAPINYFSVVAIDAEASEHFTLSPYNHGQLLNLTPTITTISQDSPPPAHGPMRQAVIGNINENVYFDKIIIDLTEDAGPALYDNITFNTVPIPASIFLLGSGLIFIMVIRGMKPKVL